MDMAEPISIALTLTLIAAVESNNGTMTAHNPIRSPSSIHFGESAMGRYALMPATLAQLGTQNQEIAAKRLLMRIRRHYATSCPWVALIAWERGYNRAIKASDWFKARRRMTRARLEWPGLVQRSKWAGKRFVGWN